MKKVKIVFKKLAETEDRDMRIKEGDVGYIVDFTIFDTIPSAIIIMKKNKRMILLKLGDFHKRADIKSY